MPDRNPLGLLRRIEGVAGVWNRATGVTVVKFQDGTLMRIPQMSYDESMAEATRLEVRANVIRAIAGNRAARDMGRLKR